MEAKQDLSSTSIEIGFPTRDSFREDIIEQMVNEDNPETDLYFCLSDHLGSSSFITDLSGAAVEHLQYMPFGESFIDQRGTGHDIRFKFSGKEKDAETGYSYFGARYYDSDLSVWLSVDPMSDMYPSTSPFMYVLGNPVRLIDPNGLWDKDANGNWTATKGDSWWSLHKESGMSWKETMAYGKKYNAARGQDNWKHVGVGDKVTLPGIEPIESSSSVSAVENNSQTSGEKFIEKYNLGPIELQSNSQNVNSSEGSVWDPLKNAIYAFTDKGDISPLLNILTDGGPGAMVCPAPLASAGAAARGVKVLQTGGNILKPATLKALNLTKQQGKYAIESMKKANGLRNDFHGKIMSNGDILDDMGRLIDNLLDYLH